MKFRNLRVLLQSLVVIAIVAIGASGWAQNTTASAIAGTVTDSTGAAVANAKVTVRNQQTGQVATTTSTASGF